MTIEIICTGKLKEKYWQDAAAEYVKRLSRFCTLKITELPEARQKEDSEKGERAVIEEESKAALSKISQSPDVYTIALDVCGKELDSPTLAKEFSQLSINGKSHIVFIIGGSLGLSEELLKACNLRLSFSKMTFPHQLMRVILLEQIYRAFKINSNETYHK